MLNFTAAGAAETFREAAPGRRCLYACFQCVTRGYLRAPPPLSSVRSVSCSGSPTCVAFQPRAMRSRTSCLRVTSTRKHSKHNARGRSSVGSSSSSGRNP